MMCTLGPPTIGNKKKQSLGGDFLIQANGTQLVAKGDAL